MYCVIQINEFSLNGRIGSEKTNKIESEIRSSHFNSKCGLVKQSFDQLTINQH